MVRNLKELLVEAKDASELMVDLAFAALFFGDRDLAREVTRLEERMNEALHEMRVLSMLAARSPADAEQLAAVLGFVNAIEEIGDAAEDIAHVVLRDLDVPSELREDLRYAEEVTSRVKLREDTDLAGQSLTDLSLPAETGMWVIAIRRDVDWLYGPSGETVLHHGDVLFCQGPAAGVDRLRELAGGEPYGLAPPVPQGRLSHLDHAVDLLVELKNSAEVAVGLAYSAVLFRERGLAGEVSEIEERCDRLYDELQRWILRAARDLDDEEVDELRGLLEVGAAAERIADAAQELTRIAESDEEPHPVVAVALREADEIVTDAHVEAGSSAAGHTIRELTLHTTTGMDVLAVQRDGRWRYRPRSALRLEPGDRLVATGPIEGVAALRAVTGDRRPQTEDADYWLPA